jgi:hypothetical protein
MAAKQVSWSSTRVEDEQFIVSIFPLPMIDGAVYLTAQSASFRVQDVWHGEVLISLSDCETTIFIISAGDGVFVRWMFDVGKNFKDAGLLNSRCGVEGGG